MAPQTGAHLDLGWTDNGQDTLGVAAWACVDWLPPYGQGDHLNDWPVDDNMHHPAAMWSGHAAGTPRLIGDVGPVSNGFGNVHQPCNALVPAPSRPLFLMSANVNPSTSFLQTTDNVLSQPQRHICLGCKYNSKGSCHGSPYCQPCANSTGFERPPSRMAESPLLFLNYELWFSSCQELGRQLRGPKSAWRSTHSPDATCCTLILELDFEDLEVRRNISNTHLVVCDLHFVSQTDRDRRPDALVQTPLPRIDIKMFDDFVITAMWRPLCAQIRPKKKRTSKEKQGQSDPPTTEQPIVKLFKDEKDLFAQAQLIVGYYSLLCNLGSIWTDETVLHAADGPFVLAELTYLFAYRISFLIVKFSRMCPSLDDAQFEHDALLPDDNLTPRIRPGNLLYALEILYLGIKSAGPPKWNLGHVSPSHLLRGLEREAEEAYRFLLNSVLAYQCHLSGLHGSRHNIGVPGLVALVRTAGAALPKQLVVAMQRCGPCEPAPVLPASFKPFPCLHEGHSLRSIIEILSVSSSGVAQAILEGNWTPRQRFPEYWIHEDNSKSKCDLANVEYKERSENGRTDASVGYPHTATKQGLGHLDEHPDPPSSCGFESSVVALAGLHLGDEDENTGPNDLRSNWSWGTAIVTLADSRIPEQCEADFCDSQGQRRPELRTWDFRPKGVTVTRRKRKQGDDDVDGDSGSESTRPSKHRETARSLHPNMLNLLAGTHGREAILKYLNLSPSS